MTLEEVVAGAVPIEEVRKEKRYEVVDACFERLLGDKESVPCVAQMGERKIEFSVRRDPERSSGAKIVVIGDATYGFDPKCGGLYPFVELGAPLFTLFGKEVRPLSTPGKFETARVIAIVASGQRLAE